MYVLGQMLFVYRVSVGDQGTVRFRPMLTGHWVSVGVSLVQADAVWMLGVCGGTVWLSAGRDI